MTCSFVIDDLKKFAKARCIVSEKDTDPVIGGEFIIILEPLTSSKNSPMYYWRKLADGRYRVEGEGYIITHDFEEAVKRHKPRVSKEWANTPMEWVERND